MHVPDRGLRMRVARSVDAEHGTGPPPSARYLGAAVGDHEIGGDAEQEPDAEHVEPELGVPEAARAGPDLADHVEDRSAGQREAAQLERIAGDLVADHRADERGTT